MARKSSSEEYVPSDTPLTAEEWHAQEPCPECGGRPGQSPDGFVLRIKLPNGEFVEGHTYQCQKRRQE